MQISELSLSPNLGLASLDFRRRRATELFGLLELLSQLSRWHNDELACVAVTQMYGQCCGGLGWT